MDDPELYVTATAEARPKPFVFPLKKTALVVLKMQKEFICQGGFGHILGNDVSYAQEIVPNVQRLINLARENNIEVIHTKEGHKVDLSDLPSTKLNRTRRRTGNLTIGDKGKLGRILIDGEEGNDIVSECYPLPNEKVITTASKGVLYDTDLHEYCMKKGIVYIILAGLVTEVGVHLVMRELNDRGFESCLIEDCTASYFPPKCSHKNISFDMIIAQGGIIGWTTNLKEIVLALKNAKPQKLPSIPDWIVNVPNLLPPNPFFPLSEPLLHGHDKKKEKFISVSSAIPYEYTFPLKKTVCIIIDMQRDFILEGGFGSTLGNKVELLQTIVPNVAFLLDTCRTFGIELIHTMEAHVSDLHDCPLAKLTRGGLPEGLRIGDEGKMGRILIREEWGNQIIDENKPLPGEKVLFKPGKGAFYQTDLHEYLLSKDITHILFAGVTTEVCVQTSMREANDRGFECLMVSDCTESYFPEFKASTLEMLTNQGAIVGWCATSTQVRDALNSALKGGGRD